MDRIDLLIIIFLISAIYRGLRTGLLQLALSTIGFILGLIAGSEIALLFIRDVSSPLSRLILVLGIEIGFALILSGAGDLSAHILHKKYIKKIGVLNEILGGIFEILAVFFIIWLVAPSVSDVQEANLGYYVQHSYMIKTIDSSLPPSPDYIAHLEGLITPNGYPSVFLGLEPGHTSISPNNKVNEQAVLADESSVVQIDGNGCGGLVQGSGFVIGKGIVVTNAHVIAGISSPRVLDHSGSYNATPIWFDPNLDLAVLRVKGLKDSSLAPSSQTLTQGNSGDILGFPGGGPLVINSAVVIDQVVATGRNIYNQGQVSRSIYEIESKVEPGNSGGPLIGANGEVYGIVFAKSVTQPDLGYALAINQLIPTLNQAQATNRIVSDGSCSSE